MAGRILLHLFVTRYSFAELMLTVLITNFVVEGKWGYALGLFLLGTFAIFLASIQLDLKTHNCLKALRDFRSTLETKEETQ